MHSEPVVLAIENTEDTRLSRLLNGWGYSVLAVTDIEPALSRIQHVDIAAAVMEGTGRNDPLEFVLNAREFNEMLPIIIVGPAIDSELYKVLEKQLQVAVIPEEENGMDAKIAEAVESAIA